jgi:TnpA family transposase
MPRQEILSPAQHAQLLMLPADTRQIADRYTFTQADLDLIAQCRGDQNRMGFAIQLCLLRYPGRAWTPEESIPVSLLGYVAGQLAVTPDHLASYASRDQTRREHLAKLVAIFDWKTFGLSEHREVSTWLLTLARGTDRGLVLVKALLEELRQRRILAPALSVLDRLASAVRHRARREAYRALTADLRHEQRLWLDALLAPYPDSRLTHLGWLRQAGGAPNPTNISKGIERLTVLRKLGIPDDWARRVHQNRLLQTAREGANTDAAHLREFGDERRHATLVAVVLDTMATLTDETLEMHERVIGREFKKAERRHLDTFQESSKAINEKVRLYATVGRALIEAKTKAVDPFPEIEKLMTWEAFLASVEEAAKLAGPEEFDHLALVGNGYSYIRRYAPEFLNAFEFRAAPAGEELLKAIHVLRDLNTKNIRNVPKDSPTGFVRRRWKPHVFEGTEIDRRFYELCVLSELRNALRSGDLWVVGSRQFKDFEEYLLSPETFAVMKPKGLPLAIKTGCQDYLDQRGSELHETLTDVNGLAERGELPDASLIDGVLKVTPLTNAVPPEAHALTRQVSAMLPRIKITDLLMEVDAWTGFSRHFVHLRNGDTATERTILLTAILADAINLGLNRMADACPGVSLSRLSWIADWHVRDETYSKGLAEIVNYHRQQPFAGHWGEGTTSSSDGQRFRAGGVGEAKGEVNARYGNDPGVTFYTHVSDQYSPFHTKVINATVRDATHVLDGLLYHESDLRIEEHYTDTGGFTDHVFGLCHLLGYRFAPRIRDLADKRLATIEKPARYPALEGLIGNALNTKQITAHWDEILRLATSIQQGTVTASLILRKLGAYPRQNGLALALRELGRLERSLFTLQYLKDMELRRRIHVGLNKGEARNALARAVFFNRLGEIRDRTYENQRYRASGLNLVVAAIVLWNTVYLDRAVKALREREREQPISEDMLAHLSPLGWEHINLTGDYVWKPTVEAEIRPLRQLRLPIIVDDPNP